jgi:hypothetical protein
VTCEKCNAPLVIGAFPFCPHGSSTLSAVGDDIPGGMVAENGFNTPQVFYTKSDHRRALAAKGLEVGAKWVPGDKHLTRWDAVDAQTLENARILVSRQRSVGTEPPIVCETAQFTARTVEAE